MSNTPTITSRVLDAIANAEVRAKVGEVIELCVVAVTKLDSLDQGIYRCTRAAEAREGDGLPTGDEIDGLAIGVLGGVRALAAHLERSESVLGVLGGEDEASLDFDFDLGGGAAVPEEVSLDEDDIDSVLDGFAPQSRRSGDERWAALSREMRSFSYALSAQLDDFDQRFAGARDSGRIPQALRELDDAGNALIDGVFALMSTICETFLESFDRDQMLPGHRDALGKALLVRRGIADLRRSVKLMNVCIQYAEASQKERKDGIATVAADLFAFIESEVWGVMRPADRLELQNFHEEISNSPLKKAALCCEGLDKYLDSLLSVNQRDVLIRHDREVLVDIAATLEGVGPIVDISPHGAMDMVRQAFDKARALRGYRDPLDDLLTEWEHDTSKTEDPAAMVEIGKRLAALTGLA